MVEHLAPVTEAGSHTWRQSRWCFAPMCHLGKRRHLELATEAVFQSLTTEALELP
jgi:hypothetical protein